MLAANDRTHPHMGGTLTFTATACLCAFPFAQSKLSFIALLARVYAVALVDKGVDQDIWLGFIRLLVLVELWNGDLFRI